MKIKLGESRSNIHSAQYEFKLKLWNPLSWHVRISLSTDCDIGLNDYKVSNLNAPIGRDGKESW